MEVAVIIGTHGGLRAKPYDESVPHQPRSDGCENLFPVTWPRHVEVCGITMPFGGNVNYANDTREKQAVDTTRRHLLSGSLFSHNSRKIRHLADELLDSDAYLPDACVNGSENQFSVPKIHDKVTLEGDLDEEVSSTMEGVTGFDAVKGCVVSARMDPRQIIANYVPLVYSNTGNIEQTATGLTKVPLCSKVFTLNFDEYSIGKDTNPSEKSKAEWKVTLLIKQLDGTVTTNPQFVQELFLVAPPPDVFGTDPSHHLRADDHGRAFYTETLISYLISKGYQKIIIVDVTCCVFRNSGPYRAAGYPFGSVCEHGITPPTRMMLDRTVTPWIMLSRFGIRETYERADSHFYPERGYYNDRFRNATPDAVRALIEKYYSYLQLAFNCKQAVLHTLVASAARLSRTKKQTLKDTTPATKTACIQAFFDLYKERSKAMHGRPITQPPDRPRSISVSPPRGARDSTPPRGARGASNSPGNKAKARKVSSPRSPLRSGGRKKHKTRHGKRNKSLNVQNKSRFRRTRRRAS